MKSLFVNIRAKYEDMGPGEQKIATLLMAEPNSILPLTINEFAKKAGCGNATLVRFQSDLA